MKKEEIAFLKKIVDSIEEAAEKLEEAYEKKDVDSFNSAKKFMLIVQRRLKEEVK
jgi:mevalonate kinase